MKKRFKYSIYNDGATNHLYRWRQGECEHFGNNCSEWSESINSKLEKERFVSCKEARKIVPAAFRK